MNRYARFLFLIVGILSVGNASALGVGQPVTYTNLTWGVSNSISGFSTCTELRVDATGDLVTSNKIVIYGGLNCPTGTYGITGSGYLSTSGTVVMNLILGLGNSVLCNNLANLSGTCSVYSAAGYYLGALYITLR